jgi:hypothetical protein
MGREHLKDVGVYGETILKWTSPKEKGVMRTALSGSEQERMVGCFEHGSQT